eukprot:723597-Heterocapsa_arctica.AAC.1
MPRYLIFSGFKFPRPSLPSRGCWLDAGCPHDLGPWPSAIAGDSRKRQLFINNFWIGLLRQSDAHQQKNAFAAGSGHAVVSLGS